MIRAFTLIELIFVIVIIGLISSIGKYFIPDLSLIANVQALKSYIETKRSNAIGYEANTSDEQDEKYVCVKFDYNYIKDDEMNSKVKFAFKKSIIDNLNVKTEDNETVNELCFDKYGRPYNGKIDDNMSNFLKKFVIITLFYKDQNKTIIVAPYTGFIK